MKKYKLGIDLDDTLVNSNHKRYESIKVEVKKSVIKWLPKLYDLFEFHLITARANRQDVNKIIAKVEYECSVQFESITLTCFEKKGEFASKIGCLWMIDDYPDYIVNCQHHNVIPILLNKKKYKRVYPHFVVCENWEEITKYLQKEYKKLEEKETMVATNTRTRKHELTLNKIISLPTFSSIYSTPNSRCNSSALKSSNVIISKLAQFEDNSKKMSNTSEQAQVRNENIEDELKMRLVKKEPKLIETSCQTQKKPKKSQNIDTSFLEEYIDDQDVIDTLSPLQIKELKRTYMSSRKYVK